MHRGGKIRSIVCAIVTSVLWGLIQAHPAAAGITALGDIVPLYDASDPWVVPGDLRIGTAADASLVVSAGSRVQSDRGLIGLSGDEFDISEVTVTGAGSLWQNDSELVVGAIGRGMLFIESGGQVTSPFSSVALGADSSGTAFVRDSGSQWDSDALHVGVGGLSTVYIEEGGRVTDRTAVLGVESMGTGVVLISGPGSVWENVWDSESQLGGDLHVGYSGVGDVGIGGGGRIVSHAAILGYNATGDGEINVSGTGSLWENTTTMQIGRAGGGRLGIFSGGRVTTREAVVAVEAGSEGIITVEGPDSAWEVDWGMVLGSRGNAILSVLAGGHVETQTVTMGAEAGSTATVTVSGADSRWSGSGATYVGVEGRADLLVSNGASVWDQGILGIGTAAGGLGTVVVTGTDSSVGGDVLQVGLDGGRGSMTITDGGRGGASEAWVGAGAGSLGEVVVTDPDSAWGATYDLTIGHYYGEGRLTVSNGAHVSAAQGFIGSGPGSLGTVVVTGPGSLLQTEHALYIGGDADGPGGTGSLRIANGGLVDGNEVTVWSTGVLTGDGTLRADVDNRGTIRPGNSIGTLTIDGDLSAISDTSVIEFEIDNEGNSDKLLVSGFFGFRRRALVPVPIETLVGTHEYTVVEADRIEERIQTMEWPYPAVEPGLIRSTIAYGTEPNSVLLRVTALPFGDPNMVRTGNQRSLGAALDRIAEEGGNELTMALQGLDTSDAVRSAYDQLSGQTVPSLAPVSVAGTTRHMGMIAGRLRNPAGGLSRDSDLGESSERLVSGTDTLGVDAGRYLFAVGNGSPMLGDKPWGVWGKGYGLYGDRESESGVPGYQYTVYGAAFGVDYRFTDALLLGLTGGYSDGDINYSGSRDSSDVAATHGGLYGGYETSRWYLDSILTYADLDYETRRYVDLTGERLEGDPTGDMLTGYLEAGLYRWRSERTLIQPLAAFQFSTLKIDSFTETGGDSALTFDDERYESYKGSLGVELTRRLLERAGGFRMDLELRGRWVHEFGDTKASFDAGFASDPGVTFRVSDEDISRDSAILGAGLDTWFTRQTRLFVDYGTELNPDHTIHLLSAGLEHRW